MKIRTPLVSMTLCIAAMALYEQAASACYSGPIPLDFKGRTEKLTDTDEAVLAGYARDRWDEARLLVIFYKSDASQKLVEARRRSVRAYLLSKGLAPADFSVVSTGKPPSAALSRLFGSRPTATAELTTGCGR